MSMVLPQSANKDVRNRQMRNDARNGMNSKEIAAKYGLSISATQHICAGLFGVGGDSTAQKRNDAIRKEYNAGATHEELAKKYGKKVSQIKGILKRKPKQGYVNIELTTKRPKPRPLEPVTEMVSVHSPVKVYHISALPKEEQERIMNLHDPYRTEKKPMSGFIPRHP